MTSPIEALTSLASTFTGYVTDAIPLLIPVVVAVFGIWFIPKVVRWIKGVAR